MTSLSIPSDQVAFVHMVMAHWATVHSLHHIMPEDQGEYCATGEGLSDCSTRQEFKPQQSQKSERFANSFTDFEPVFAALINEILAFPPSSSWPVQALFTHAVVDVSPVELKTRLLN